MSWFKGRAAIAGFSLLLSAACGFEPLYREDGSAIRLKDAVIVESTGDDLGFEVENALIKRLGSPSSPQYLVGVRTRVVESEVAVGGLDGFERFNLGGTSEIEVRALGGDRLLYEGSVEDSVAYSSTRETFHTLNARRDARRRLAVQLAERIAWILEANAEYWNE